MSFSLHSIPPSGPVPADIVAVRKARDDFAMARGQLLYKLQDQQELATATQEMLGVIYLLVSADHRVPYQLSMRKTDTTQEGPTAMPGTLSPQIMQCASKLQALANSWGYRIEEHPELRSHGRLYPIFNHDFPENLGDLCEPQ